MRMKCAAPVVCGICVVKYLPLTLLQVRYTFLSLARLAEMGCPFSSPFPLAIYSLSLVLAKKACFWDPTGVWVCVCVCVCVYIYITGTKVQILKNLYWYKSTRKVLVLKKKACFWDPTGV